MHGNNASQEFNRRRTQIVPQDQHAWHFRLVGARERPHIKRFIASAFGAAYGARLQSYMPQLAALHRGDLLLAACGLRPAFDERLFLENYLDGPIERALAEVAGRRVERGELVEVGNLAIARAGAARALITHLTEHLVARGVSYVVCTIVPALSNNFARLGIPLHRLADARVDRLPPPLRANWGTYYEHKPVVTAIGVADAANALRVAR
jgi:hypothetical protein